MTRITLNTDQSMIYFAAGEPIEICDVEGKVLGKILPPKLEELIAECKRRAQKPGPRYTGAQVRETLRVLEETWSRDGPFGIERAMQILQELRKKRAS